MSLIHTLLSVAPIQFKATDLGLPTSTPTIQDGLTKILNLLFFIVGTGSVIVIIYGGLRMAASAGNPAQYKIGRDSITYAIIGLVISIAGYAIVTLITSLL